MTTPPPKERPFRLTVNITQQEVGVLDRYARRFRIDRTNAVRKVIALAHMIETELSDGGALILERPGRKPVEVRIL